VSVKISNPRDITVLYEESSKGHFAVVPTIVGKREVYVRPNCIEFLSEVGKIAIVSV